jgi:hypothetical protein
VPERQGGALAFAIDTHDREVMAYVATTGGISGEMIRDPMLACVERRFAALRAPHPVQWLADNGSAYTAHDTRDFAVAPNLVACVTPVRSPQRNGISEAFMKTFKRDYARIHPRLDAAAVLQQLPAWIEDLYERHLVNRDARGCSAANDMRGTRMDLYPAEAIAPHQVPDARMPNAPSRGGTKLQLGETPSSNTVCRPSPPTADYGRSSFSYRTGLSTAPSSRIPCFTKRQSATASFLASATMPILRERVLWTPKVPRYHSAKHWPVGSAARSGQVLCPFTVRSVHSVSVAH